MLKWKILKGVTYGAMGALVLTLGALLFLATDEGGARVLECLLYGPCL